MRRNKRKLYAIGNWWVFPGRRIAVCVPAKCGGTSFYRAAFGVPPDVGDKAVYGFMLANCRTRGPFSFLRASEEADKHYLAIREPVARFSSLWRDKCRDATHETAGDPRRQLYRVMGMPPGKLMDYIKANPKIDAHWRRQSLDMRAGVTPVRYDRLLQMLALPSVLCNETEAHDDDATMPVQEILEHYSADVALWNQVKDDG